MKPSGRTVMTALLIAALWPCRALPAAQAPPAATFSSGVDLVSLAAIVRDHRGRLVKGLVARDFVVVDNGAERPIADFRSELAGVTATLLFDASGSMEARLATAREVAGQLLGWLDPARDEAGVFAFDTKLDELTPFTPGLRTLPASLASLRPFGATSLYDAIAGAARRVAMRDGRRRAVIVFSDGDDNWSRLTPGEVSGIASAIDVPVYVIGVVPSIDNPSADVAAAGAERSTLAGPLSDLASWTGGHAFIVSTPDQRSAAARQIVDELREQYVMAFESGGSPGWHPLEIRARDKGLSVRARSGYIAGPRAPISH
jgi:Ca-activated chloride channel family protein